MHSSPIFLAVLATTALANPLDKRNYSPPKSTSCTTTAKTSIVSSTVKTSSSSSTLVTSAKSSSSTSSAKPSSTSTGPNSAYCAAVSDVVSALKPYASATPFCSSYLGITTQTVTSTSTITSASTTALTTTTGTNTITAAPVTTTVTSTSTVSSCRPSAGKLKRGSSPSHAKPVPSCVNPYEDPRISSACSCLSIPTPTVTKTVSTTVYPVYTSTVNVAATTTTTPTVTSTVTATSTTYSTCPTPDLSCNNQGVQWAYYYNDQGDSTDSDYSTFSPEHFKTVQPQYQSVVSYGGGVTFTNDHNQSIYGSPPMNSDFFVLNHQTYLFAPQTGNYLFSMQVPDDSLWFWYNGKAQSGWTRDNADLENSFGENKGPNNYTLYATQGSYTPFRFLFAQAQGYAYFNYTITAPDGTTLDNFDSTYCEYLVQYSCDGVSAPQFQPFGSQT